MTIVQIVFQRNISWPNNWAAMIADVLVEFDGSPEVSVAGDGSTVTVEFDPSALMANLELSVVHPVLHATNFCVKYR